MRRRQHAHGPAALTAGELVALADATSEAELARVLGVHGYDELDLILARAGVAWGAGDAAPADAVSVAIGRMSL